MRIRTVRLKESCLLDFCMVLTLMADKTYATPVGRSGNIFMWDGLAIVMIVIPGISYDYDGGVHVITVSGSRTLGHSGMGKYSGIYAN